MNFFFECMKFLFSAVAAYVGITAVRNSTKSVNIATESIRVTKEKEQREQSSHPMILSLIAKFPYRAPMYEKNVSYNFPRDIINGSIMEKRRVRAKDDREFIKDIKDSLVKQDTYDYYLELFNSGKGSCVNIEYEFKFINIKDFIGYSVKYENPTNIVKSTKIPSYSLSLNEYERIFEIITTDNHIAKFVESTETSQEFESYATKNSLKFDKKTTIRNYNYLESGKKTDLPIPNEFIVLSRHYALVEILKRKVRNNEMFEILLPSIQPLLKSNPIVPIGRVTISFYDESLIRTGAYSPDKKTKITYSVAIKESAINIYDNEFEMYLEANLIQPESTP